MKQDQFDLFIIILQELLIFYKISMGKHKKRKRESQGSFERSRSRSKNKRNKRSQSPQSHRQKASPISHKNLTNYNHRYYLSNESKTVGLPYVVWNLCIHLASRPSNILIICQSMAHLATIRRACRLQRSLRIIDQTPHNKKIQDLIKEKAEIIMTTQKKCSILVALEEEVKAFDVIINVSQCFDADFYIRLTGFAKDRGTLITFANTASSIKKLSEAIAMQIQQCETEPSSNQKQRQLINDIRLAARPSSETLTLLKELNISYQQIAGRLLQLEKARREPPKSIHLSMPGYISYRLDMDVEFNSLKYVWNFLRQEFPRSLYEQVRGMHKYENEKGVVFNIPEELRYVVEGVSQKLKRHKAKFKGIDIQECSTLPPLEDTQSQQYKLLREKKKAAIQNKSELQIFIGGVPYQMDQNSLKHFFKQKGVTLYLVRILKDEMGFSKGIGFGLCQNREHFEKALLLNGSRLVDRTIRVKLADQRKD